MLVQVDHLQTKQLPSQKEVYSVFWLVYFNQAISPIEPQRRGYAWARYLHYESIYLSASELVNTFLYKTVVIYTYITYYMYAYINIKYMHACIYTSIMQM